jgi:hypothetical protein
MLLSILEQTVMSRNRLSKCVHVGLWLIVVLLWCALGLGAPAMTAMAFLEKRLVRLLALLSFGVRLCSLLVPATLRHLTAPL